ncbi:hypothetical protein E0Z10_g5307 [Xylaria hypoxylon]|uniref:Uncharacterized protein n=1 Tax=Xylaria hypoxylon TaxID=37992 RepID=A0A4Z0YGK5_9PEZI|nr:hypothetical protein E0Z10_g5307 [Xylaria hypoxylon]
MDGLNDYRTARVAEVLSDFRTLQYYIAAAPTEPLRTEDYYTEGWAALRQCALDGQHILNCAADVTVPQTNGGEEEQSKAELKQVLLDAIARRHEAQKIYLRQAAAQRWVEYREQVLQGHRPSSSNRRQLRACDEQLRSLWIAGRPKIQVYEQYNAGFEHGHRQYNTQDDENTIDIRREESIAYY